ncbi:MAG TPA: enoyl-CoA hydratase/isomerase family protein [Steroidobacteraceae bacterium]
MLSPLSGPTHVVVELGANDKPAATDLALLSAWSREQACPVIGIAAAGDGHALAAACDAVVVNDSDAAELAANIEVAPITAMVLVQLLRSSEGLEVARALVFESLAYATLQAGGEFKRWLAQAQRPAAAQVTEPGAPVLIERDGAQVRLRLNRPARRNALSIEMRDALAEALELVAMDASITEVTISGEGRCFCAGGDLGEFGSAPDAAVGHAVRSTRPVPQLLARCAPRLRFRVHGAAVGAGMEMAAFGAYVEATPETFFHLPEIRFGLIPGSGGCVSIARRIGRLRTGLLALSARRLDARTALAWGLIDRLVETQSQPLSVPA